MPYIVQLHQDIHDLLERHGIRNAAEIVDEIDDLLPARAYRQIQPEGDELATYYQTAEQLHRSDGLTAAARIVGSAMTGVGCIHTDDEVFETAATTIRLAGYFASYVESGGVLATATVTLTGEEPAPGQTS